MNKWNIDFVKVLKDYTEDVSEAVLEETKTVAEESADTLRSNTFPSGIGSPGNYTRREWKRYAKSWGVNTVEGEGFVHCSVHNKKHYRLTHLLEYGHATRDGGRTRSFPHIKPVEQTSTEKLEKNIKKIIEKGGKL